ncbi:GNAT family N-acetyltransferase [Glycomyces algeriensis]|uniref:N-acetyltransferase n=1 Tax=Glycomyces algeriensis TaxID=256037 RepID=A0A9W6LH81_9ACTN|nr:GNAT family N-acetyltransferase [Glycomyces algeriensis]MDA1364617.1 GNAT family N-acetyltransferase [Glycomyces algeriensis]MDR7350654.1 putative GNAT family acetyltransferase [Glycomyces algeriensis]GLI43363.1 N-acetyltransferase [Glycomyces algeriensis]
MDVTDAPERSRYEVHEDGELLGYAEYVRREGIVTFTHTVVFPEAQGKGAASVMVRVSLDEVRSRGERVRPLCPYYASWIERHPDYQDLVVEGRSLKHP